MGASQTVLPFKLGVTDETLTAHGGLALFGEYSRAMDVGGLVDHELSGPGSAAGYDPSAHVLPLVLMLAGGGRTLEDKSPYRYHAIASNRDNEDAAATMEWYSKRGDASENRIKDLKIGFGMEYMPCGSFEANAVFFAVGVLAYNLYLGFRGIALGKEWERAQVQTVRWRLFQTAGKIVRHGRQLL